MSGNNNGNNNNINGNKINTCNPNYPYIFDVPSDVITKTCGNMSVTCKLYNDNIAEIYDINYNGADGGRQKILSLSLCIRNMIEELESKGYTKILQLLYYNDYNTIKKKTKWTIIKSCTKCACNNKQCMYNGTVLVCCNINEFIDNFAIGMDLL